MQLPKLNVTNLSEQVYDILKERIIRGELTPKQKLLVPELAEKMGISRTPMRDALNRLEMEGLVRTIPKVGTFVRAIETDEALDIFDSRLMMEFWTAEKLERLPKERVQEMIGRMGGIVDQAKQELECDDSDLYNQSSYDLSFHIEFIKVSGNEKNVEFYKNLMTHRLLTVGSSWVTRDMFRYALDQHQMIVDALKMGGTAEIKNTIYQHLDYSRENLLKVMS